MLARVLSQFRRSKGDDQASFHPRLPRLYVLVSRPVCETVCILNQQQTAVDEPVVGGLAPYVLLEPVPFEWRPLFVAHPGHQAHQKRSKNQDPDGPDRLVAYPFKTIVCIIFRISHNLTEFFSARLAGRIVTQWASVFSAFPNARNGRTMAGSLAKITKRRSCGRD